jgi:uncharacterized protein YgiM (DUF1202 family)
VHKFRRGALIAVIALMIGGGLARWRDTQPVTSAATPAATVAATPFPTPTQQHATPRPVVATAIRTAEPSHKAEVIPDGLNVRNAPGGAIVGSLKQGATVTVLTVQGEWAKIGEGRFVAARYLKVK